MTSLSETDSPATRRNLSRSVAEFFSKLRPSKRPERGGTFRPTTEDFEVHQPVEPASPVLSRSCERKSPSSVSRHDPDTIPASRWNTPTTLPRRARSRDLLVARRALRRRRQHTLISSGDFLGVTGANPYTGEPDVITPPTPSDDAIVTTSSSSLLPPPPPPSRLGSSQLDHQQVWDLDSHVVVPVDLGQLSEGCRAQRTSSDRIPKLHELGLIDLSKGSQPCVADSPRGGNGLKIKGHPREIVHGLGRALQSACTRTTTTTGFGQRHGQPRHRTTAHPCGAMRDRWHEAPPDLGASMPKAHSQSTSPPFPTTTLNDICFTRPVSPGSVRLSVWPNLDGRDPRRATAVAIPKEAERCRGLGSPTLLPHLVLEAGSDTTSSLTDQETTVPVQGHQHSATVGQPATGDENRSPRQRYWRMRETMRKLALPGETNLDGEVDTGASSPTYTRTSICCITEQPRTSRSAIPPRKHGNQTFARGAARTAFVHYVETTTTNTTIVPKPISAPGISCCRRQGRAAEMTAKKPDHIGEAAVREGRLGRYKAEQGREIVKGKERENQEAKSKEEQMEKVADMTNRKKGTSSPDVKYWARQAMLVLARMLSAYWQVVSPVFSGDSDLRKRLDKSRATRGDVVGVESRPMPGLPSSSAS
ncbi:uncharacterized protein P884DRAFT_277908 [Thermothelomyces heterothallicus CBS 202.75]|uniref:uncharacterized protein n=1 Tax=Thermothelomyces heterothallicus CBS 202.75 TaxID=1149848 RepID=UPI003741F678